MELNLKPRITCVTNLKKSRKWAALEAIAETCLPIEWRDEPDEHMPECNRSKYGSIWSSADDQTAFWTAYKVRPGER